MSSENQINVLPLLDIWNKLLFPNFLNTLPLISINCERTEEQRNKSSYDPENTTESTTLQLQKKIMFNHPSALVNFYWNTFANINFLAKSSLCACVHFDCGIMELLKKIVCCVHH